MCECVDVCCLLLLLSGGSEANIDLPAAAPFFLNVAIVATACKVLSFRASAYYCLLSVSRAWRHRIASFCGMFCFVLFCFALGCGFDFECKPIEVSAVPHVL